jgi:hypothetical protein
MKFLASIITGELWTAAKDSMKLCPGEYRWCSNTKFADSLKRNLFWREIYQGRTNSCVYINIDNALNRTKFDTSLGLADCGDQKRFICEVFEYQIKVCFWATSIFFFNRHMNLKNTVDIFLRNA